jgi:hypothetical protein
MATKGALLRRSGLRRGKQAPWMAGEECPMMKGDDEMEKSHKSLQAKFHTKYCNVFNLKLAEDYYKGKNFVHRFHRLAIRCTHCCRNLQPISRWSVLTQILYCSISVLFQNTSSTTRMSFL